MHLKFQVIKFCKDVTTNLFEEKYCSMITKANNQKI